MTNEELTGRAKGGKARAEALSPSERSEIARRAAAARWESQTPTALHEGSFQIGDASIACAVLPDGKRIITQATFLRALGRSRSPKAGTGVMSTADDLPFFLQADALRPFVSSELRGATTPIFYKSLMGTKGVGYDATMLPQVAEVYLLFRDAMLKEKGKVPAQYEHIVKAADILVRGLANVGIIALVDEATGFQKDRARDALARILEAFVAKELQPWVKTFPVEFYEQMFRLRSLPYPSENVGRPKYFGHLTNDVIYRRLAPGVLAELKHAAEQARNSGKGSGGLHQRLTPDLGHPKLRELLAGVIMVMRLSSDWNDFKEKLDRVQPAYGTTLPLPLEYAGEKDSGRGF